MHGNEHADADAPRARRTLRQRIAAGDSYGIVLVLIVIAIAVGVTTAESVGVLLVQVVIQAAALLVTLRASLVTPRTMRIAVVLVGLGTLAALGLTLAGEFEQSRSIARAFEATLAFAAPVVILRRLFRHFEVTAETVLGALCVYLLIGLSFAYLYGAVDTLGGADFFTQTEDAQFSDFIYFSYVTQATVGYGDLTPAMGAGRGLAVANGLLGQLYLVTVVSVVVGNLGRARPRLEESRAREP